MIKSGLKFALSKINRPHRPNFLIIGAQKAGTTSLHYFLNRHPNLIGATKKEVSFFSRDENYALGTDWYHSHFLNTRGIFKPYLYFESTPEYLYRSFVAKRLFTYNPLLKLIVVLRNPVSRAYSAWNMYYHFSEERSGIPNGIVNGYLSGHSNNIFSEFYSGAFPTFEEAIQSELLKIEAGNALEEPGLLRRGLYLPQIQRFHQTFAKEQILILGSGDLKNKQHDTLNEVLDFLEIKPFDWSKLTKGNKHVRDYDAPMKPATKAWLEEFYRPRNEELFSYLGKEINW